MHVRCMGVVYLTTKCCVVRYASMAHKVRSAYKRRYGKFSRLTYTYTTKKLNPNSILISTLNLVY